MFKRKRTLVPKSGGVNNRTFVAQTGNVSTQPVVKSTEEATSFVVMAGEEDSISDGSVKDTASDDAVLIVKGRDVAVATVEDFGNRRVFKDGAERSEFVETEKNRTGDMNVKNKSEARFVHMRGIDGDLDETGVSVVGTKLITFKVDRDAETRM